MRDDGVIFQVNPAEGPTAFEVFFGRQLSEPKNGWEDTRVVGVNFVFELTDQLEEGTVEEIEIWSDEFSDIDAFYSAVEASASFKMAQASQQLIGTFYTQEV